MQSHNVMSDYSNVGESENIKVYIRLRPPANGQEPSKDMFEIPPNNQVMTLKNPTDTGSAGGGHKFKFDACFDEHTSQEHVYQRVADPLVSKVLSGFNACCFAYGQTGSGKTYSIYGTDKHQVRKYHVELLLIFISTHILFVAIIVTAT